jgi:hypothetical protein
LKCQYCDRELKNQGAKNLHERACKENPKNDDNKENIKDNKEKCKHNLILLNENIKCQKRAINDGFTVYCLKCKELL